MSEGGVLAAQEITTEIKTSRKTRLLYTLSSLGVSIPAEAIAGIIVFYIVDVKNLSAQWYASFWLFYTIYNALNNPVLGYFSDRTRSRWGRRIPYILFGGLPYCLMFALIFMAPFDGATNPVGLLIYFGIVIVVWEGLYTALATGYYGLLPEMFDSHAERTDVAAKMNIFQVIGLIIGAALPPMLATLMGWTGMGLLLAAISVVSIYAGIPAMFEKKASQERQYVPFIPALKATFLNRSFLTVALAQAMRFFATGTLQSGMLFYMKYSLKVGEDMATTFFAIAFLIAMFSLYPWRWLVADRFGSRKTLMLANFIMLLGVIPFGLAQSIPLTYLAAAIVGIGLGGLVLIGDVIVAEVVDEDEYKMGQQRAGMYFGMSSFIITLSGLLVSSVFGLILPAYGYDTLLAVQPASVDEGFRIYLTIPPIIGFLLAILALYFYPLHGARLAQVKAVLSARRQEEDKPATRE